ncbi:YqaJ viral recombinase family protein [Candidatus Sodalis endolongispinus]|uniref:YqaJ viral recombinase family protein n=1 Tax=Candidatus Sodalis endolongispinus TaxID=2812662 RepID=A0ABS5YE07_9GAMM|nr:YqaJ viral recombinase family protein [Candidatus Sodalis endolongispinus]MBT9432824.1 YqaJ viral recombinase family protein [Candidatus Sodalis endolongispinus]
MKSFRRTSQAICVTDCPGNYYREKSEFSFTNDHMLRGHEQEPIARRLYEETNFVDVTNGGFFDCCNYGDSPDGLVGNDGVIEIKSVTAAVHFETLKRRTFYPVYKWQLIGHLDCTGRYWVDFVSYCSDFPEHRLLISHRLYRKDYKEEINQLRARRKAFLHLVVTTCDVIEKS